MSNQKKPEQKKAAKTKTGKAGIKAQTNVKAGPAFIPPGTK
jgi:hypothetical protein